MKYAELAEMMENIPLQETRAQMNMRHLACARFIMCKALRAIEEHPLESGAQGVKGIEIALKLERLIRDMPGKTYMGIYTTISPEGIGFAMDPDFLEEVPKTIVVHKRAMASMNGAEHD